MPRTEPIVAVDDRTTVPHALVAQAERVGDKTLIAFEPSGARIGYAELARAAEAGSTRLADDHGLAPGTMAALYLPNQLEFVVAWFTCLFAGCVDVPINPEYRKVTLRHALDVAGARVIFTDREGLRNLADPEVAPSRAALALVVLCDGDSPHAKEIVRALGSHVATTSLRALTAPGRHNGAWRALSAGSLASIRFTSGTTGKAKGIMHSHLHMLGKAMRINRVVEAVETDVLYSPFPLHHNLSSINGLLGMLQLGATMVSAARFSASRYWPAIRECRATLGHILGPMMPMLLAQPPSPDDRRHSVRYLWTAQGSRAFVERFGAQPVQSYALSEVGVIAYRRDGGDEGSRANGVPLPEFDVRIVDELDRELPPGTPGQIAIRPRDPHRMLLGYLGDLPATQRAFRNLWYHTGDAGFLATDGQLHFTGRLGDTVRRRGVNISCEQVEAEVLAHPAVAACAVVGVASALGVGDEELHALVLLHDPSSAGAATIADIVRLLQERLPRDYVPRYFELTGDLPRTTTGKISRSELRTCVGRGHVFDCKASGSSAGA